MFPRGTREKSRFMCCYLVLCSLSLVPAFQGLFELKTASFDVKILKL